MPGRQGGGRASSGRSHTGVAASTCDPPTRGPPPTGTCQLHPLSYVARWGRRSQGGRGPEERTGRRERPRQPITSPPAPSLGGLPAVSKGADPSVACGCEGLAVKEKRGSLCWGLRLSRASSGPRGGCPQGPDKAEGAEELGSQSPEPPISSHAGTSGGAGGRPFGTGQLTRCVRRGTDQTERSRPPCRSWHWAAGARDSEGSKHRPGSGRIPEGPGLAPGPDWERPGVLIPNPPSNPLCQAAQPKGQQRLHFLKNLCFLKS